MVEFNLIILFGISIFATIYALSKTVFTESFEVKTVYYPEQEKSKTVPYNVWHIKEDKLPFNQHKTIEYLPELVNKHNGGILIDNSLPILKFIEEPAQEESWRNISKDKINSLEVSLIMDLFLDYINNLEETKKHSYIFSSIVPTKGIKDIQMKTKFSKRERSLLKIINIKIFLYEKTSNYTTLTRLQFKIVHPIKKKGQVILTHLELSPNVTESELLPALNSEIPEDHQDTGLPLEITNEFGLLYPFSTSSSNILISMQDYERNKKRIKLLEELEKVYHCYGTIGSEKLKSEQECSLQGGVWDRPVKDSHECPYYLSNKNYTNSRGGVKFGYCETPRNTQLKGFRFTDNSPENKPLCYNCKTDLIGQGTLGKCCDKQRNPDYAFPGDRNDRNLQKEQLKSVGLSIL